MQESVAYKNYLAQEKKLREAAANARLEKNKILEGGAKSDEE